MELLRHVLVFIRHLQGVYKLRYELLKTIKYNILMCRYEKILINVAAYVIPG
jgi:hypothetical protein